MITPNYTVNILICDDEQEYASRLCKQVQQALISENIPNVEIVIATSIIDACDNIQKRAFDMVIVDMSFVKDQKSPGKQLSLMTGVTIPISDLTTGGKYIFQHAESRAALYHEDIVTVGLSGDIDTHLRLKFAGDLAKHDCFLFSKQDLFSFLDWARLKVRDIKERKGGTLYSQLIRQIMSNKFIIRGKRKANYVRVILTNACNLDCYFCHGEGSKINQHVNSLDYGKLTKSLDLLFECGINKVKFLGGEPLIYHDKKAQKTIVDLIRHCSKYNADVSITTNGILLEDKIEPLIDAGLKRINISLHSLNSDYYVKDLVGRLGGGKEKYEKFLRSIDKCIALAKQGRMQPPKFNVYFVPGEQQQRVLDILDFAGKQKAIVQLCRAMPEDNTVPAISPNYFERVKTEMQLALDFLFSLPIDDASLDINLTSAASLKIRLSNEARIVTNFSTSADERPYNICNDCKERFCCSHPYLSLRLNENGVLFPCYRNKDKSFSLFDEIGHPTNAKLKLMEYLETL